MAQGFSPVIARGEILADDPFARWMQALDERHLAGLRVQEVTRALRALSSVYVERRGALGRGAALDSAGKRAAFALFYGPLHHLLTRHIVEAVAASRTAIDLVVDLGCGTGAAGAAWAVALKKAEGGRRQAGGGRRQAGGGRREAGGGRREAEGEAQQAEGAESDAAGAGPRVLGIDRHPWAVEETRWTFRVLGLSGTTRRDDILRARIEGKRRAIVLAFTANELADTAREVLLRRLIRAAHGGAQILVIEPVARSIGAWWDEWAEAFRQAGGREDTWRVEADLPERVRLLDRAAGLDHRVLTARSLYLDGTRNQESPSGTRRRE